MTDETNPKEGARGNVAAPKPNAPKGNPSRPAPKPFSTRAEKGKGGPKPPKARMQRHQGR